MTWENRNLIGHVEFARPLLDIGTMGFLYIEDRWADDQFWGWKYTLEPLQNAHDSNRVTLYVNYTDPYIPVTECIGHMFIHNAPRWSYEKYLTWSSNRWRFYPNTTWLKIPYVVESPYMTGRYQY